MQNKCEKMFDKFRVKMKVMHDFCIFALKNPHKVHLTYFVDLCGKKDIIPSRGQACLGLTQDFPNASPWEIHHKTQATLSYGGKSNTLRKTTRWGGLSNM